MDLRDRKIEEQLLALRTLTRTTGCLHEAQIMQLKLWPYMLFEKVKYELRIDPDAKSVEYLMKTKEKPKKGKPGYSDLEQVIQWLLGPEWLVKISLNGTKAFSGSRKVAALNKAEKKAYDPFIKAVEKYVERDWSDK